MALDTSPPAPYLHYDAAPGDDDDAEGAAYTNGKGSATKSAKKVNQDTDLIPFLPELLRNVVGAVAN